MAMADITVKKYDGTTDIIYYGINPAAGDGSHALWRASGSTINSAKPSLEMWSIWNGPKTARKIFGSYAYHQEFTDSTTGLISVKNSMPGTFSLLIPQSMPDTVSREGVYQFCNLLASTIWKTHVLGGYAPQ